MVSSIVLISTIEFVLHVIFKGKKQFSTLSYPELSVEHYSRKTVDAVLYVLDR